MRDLFGDADGDEKSGSLKRLLKMRKWIAAVAIPLILFHLGWLDVDGLTNAIPAVAIPENIIVDFLFGSALFQGAVFGVALYQFRLAYHRSLAFRLTLDEKTDLDTFDVLERSASDNLAKAAQRVAAHQVPPAEQEKAQRILDELLTGRARAEDLQKRMQPLEVALDAAKLIPIVLLWVTAVGGHIWSLIQAGLTPI